MVKGCLTGCGLHGYSVVSFGIILTNRFNLVAAVDIFVPVA